MNKISYMGQKQSLFFLVLLISAILLFNSRWISLDSGEVLNTEVPRFLYAYYYHYSPSLDLSNYFSVGLYPPAYFSICVHFCRYLHIDFNRKNCVLINSLYVILALIGMFLLGHSVLKKPFWGVFSSLVLANFPLFLYSSKKFVLEIGVLPWVIFAIYLLAVNIKWDNLLKSTFFGAIVGIGCLFKWTFPAYIIGPFFLSAIYALVNNPLSRKRILLNIILSSLTGIIICGIWYIFYFNYSAFSSEFKEYFFENSLYAHGSYWGCLKYNIPLVTRTLVRGITPLFLLVFLTSFILKWNKIKGYFITKLLIIWFITPLIIFCFLPSDYSSRYLLPTIPALSVLLLLAVDKFSSKVKPGLITAIIIMCLWNILYETLIYRPPQKIQQNTFLPIIEKILASADSKTSNLKIAFNGFHDSKYEETEDIFNVFWFYKIDKKFRYDIAHFNKANNADSILDFDYIISLAIGDNKSLHNKFINNKYNVMFKFRHRYRDDVDSEFDWDSGLDYIVFKK